MDTNGQFASQNAQLKREATQRIQELEECYSVIRQRNAEIESLEGRNEYLSTLSNNALDEVIANRAIIDEQNNELAKWRDAYEAELKMKSYLEGLILTAMKGE